MWVRVDPVIETLLGLEPGALTENPEVAPYPTRLAPEGTSWLVLIPPRVLEGRVWVGSEAAIDRLQDSKSRRSILSRSSLPPSLLEPGCPAIDALRLIAASPKMQELKPRAVALLKALSP